MAVVVAPAVFVEAAAVVTVVAVEVVAVANGNCAALGSS